MVNNGADLGTLLKAGSWSSSAFRAYLDMVGLESRVVATTLDTLIDLGAAEE